MLVSELIETIEQMEALQPKSTHGRVKIKRQGYSAKDYADFPVMLEQEDHQPIAILGDFKGSFGPNKKRGDICTFHGSQYHHESDKSDSDYPGRVHTSRTWHSKNEKAEDDARLFVLLWNNREELLRLAKIGLKVEGAVK